MSPALHCLATIESIAGFVRRPTGARDPALAAAAHPRVDATAAAPRAGSANAAGTAGAAAGAPAVPAEDAPPRGCGFYDSTRDLAHGLLVTEHASPDAVANALPLEDWLTLWLAASPGAAPALQ